MVDPAHIDIPGSVSLTAETYARGLHFLSERDMELAQVLETLGPPPLRVSEPGFSTLVRIIIDQQLARAAARAMCDRLLATVSPLTPERFLALDEAAIRAIGLSRPKAAYCRALALAILEEDLDLIALGEKDDATVKSELIGLKGIGPWTAGIYLLSALRRPDIWPSGDLALATAVQKLKRLAARPGPIELEEMGEKWRPWRTVAAHLLWHHYTHTGKDGITRLP
jgi:DNA-3-methyladenine glycosylase II